jgi:DNA-directed RNA polymerase sigma subunit (sigma70/sigma32)
MALAFRRDAPTSARDRFMGRLLGHEAAGWNGPPVGGDGDAQYFQDLRAYSPLPPEESLALARAIAAGRSARAALPIAASPTEAAALTERAHRGDLAWTRLAEGNRHLVVRLARRYTGRGVPLEDLIQDGNLGLLIAIDRFDPERGNRFSTYAVWWIAQALQRAVADGGRPVHLVDGREHNFREIGDQLGLTRERARVLHDQALHRLAISVEAVAAARQRGPIAPTPRATGSGEAPTPGDHREAGIDDLTPRQRTVLRAIAAGQSNHEIAAALGLSVASVRNHLTTILRALHPARRSQVASLARQAGLADAPGEVGG